MSDFKENVNLYNVDKPQMKSVVAGNYSCGCACHYVNCGGSSSMDNFDANSANGFTSTGPGCA